MNSSFTGLLGSPLRNLLAIVGFMVAFVVVATLGYVGAGWSLLDAFYMVLITVFTVGYGEVRPIDTPMLHLLTLTNIIVGCTGMILLTGALVQVFTVGQIRQILGMDKASSEIDRLKDHVIICGFGRIGVMLAKDLKDGGAAFVVLERDEGRIHQARALGYLCLQADAAEEATLMYAGIGRARILATVLPADSTNVFITLTARSLNPRLQIIARGEQPSTESKLLYAGADKVVLPTHIGAERIAEMILHPETARFVRGSDRMRDFDKTLREMGLHLEVITVPVGAGVVGQSVDEVERRGRGGFYIVQIDRQGDETLTRPPPATRLGAGDGVLVVAKVDMAAVQSVFQAPAGKVRAGRGVF